MDVSKVLPHVAPSGRESGRAALTSATTDVYHRWLDSAGLPCPLRRLVLCIYRLPSAALGAARPGCRIMFCLELSRCVGSELLTSKVLVMDASRFPPLELLTFVLPLDRRIGTYSPVPQARPSGDSGARRAPLRELGSPTQAFCRVRLRFTVRPRCGSSRLVPKLLDRQAPDRRIFTEATRQAPTVMAPMPVDHWDQLKPYRMVCKALAQA